MEASTGVGIGVGVGTGYVGGRLLTRSTIVRDVASTAGNLYGAQFDRLPVMPKFVAAYAGRRATRSLIDTHLPKAHPIVKSYIIDGVGPQVAVGLRDPNVALEHIGKQAKTLTDLGVDGIAKLFPKAGDEARKIADQAARLARIGEEFGVRSANAALGARAGRLLLAPIPILLGVAGAVAGAKLIGPAAKPAVDAAGAGLKDLFTVTPEERAAAEAEKQEAAEHEAKIRETLQSGSRSARYAAAVSLLDDRGMDEAMAREYAMLVLNADWDVLEFASTYERLDASLNPATAAKTTKEIFANGWDPAEFVSTLKRWMHQ